MNNQSFSIPTQTSNLITIGGIAGILSILCYISTVALGAFLPESIILIFAFSFPLLWIISFIGLYELLKLEAPSATLPIAVVFGIIGGALACTLLVIQQANFIWHQEALAAASTDEAKDLLKATFRGTNRVQASMDVAFDIFITISWILFGFNIARSRYFPRILGWSGSMIAASLLLLNMYTFPTAPAEAGLFDLGPLLGLWALVFFTWFTIVARKKIRK